MWRLAFARMGAYRPTVLAIGLALHGLVGAQPAPQDSASPPAASSVPQPSIDTKKEVVLHPWVVHPPLSTADAYFTNLKDGARVESPFVVRFGLATRGLVPAGHKAGRNGHHHLLIDQPLPIDLKKPLPFSANYVHFGKGQMETVVDLPPGEHTLRLLLANQDHVLYFIYSKELRVTVTKQNKNVDKAAVAGPPRVEILSPNENAVLSTAPFRIQFHASGFSIGAASAKVPDTGHFRLVLERPPQKAETIDFPAGQTEVWLQPPKDRYSARLELISNTDPGKVLARAPPVPFTVQ